MAKTKESEVVETKPFKVLSNLRHAGKHYNPGSTVELSADDAKTLLQLKVVEAK